MPMKPVTRDVPSDRKSSAAVSGPNNNSQQNTPAASSDPTSSPMLEMAPNGVAHPNASNHHHHHQSGIDFTPNSNFDSLANARLAIDTSALLKASGTGPAPLSSRVKAHAYGPASSATTSHGTVSSNNTSGTSSFISPMHQVRLNAPLGSNHQQPQETSQQQLPSSSNGQSQATSSSPTTHANISPKTPLGFAGHLLLRKRTSIAFFIELLSPDAPTQKPAVSANLEPLQQIASSPGSDNNAKSPRTFKMVSPYSQHSTLSTPSKEADINIPTESRKSSIFKSSPTTNKTQLQQRKKRRPIRPVILSFPRQTPKQANLDSNIVSQAIEEKQRRAEVQRQQFLEDRQAQLRMYAETLRQRQVIHKTRERLACLKNQTHHDYKMNMANLQRELIRQQNRERLGVATEHAQHVVMMQKLRKYLELRRAFSESFLDFAQQNDDDQGSSLYSTPWEEEVTVKSPTSSQRGPNVSFLTEGLGVEPDLDDTTHSGSEYESNLSPTRLPLEQLSSPSGSNTGSPRVLSPHIWAIDKHEKLYPDGTETETGSSPVKKFNSGQEKLELSGKSSFKDLDVLTNLKDTTREPLEKKIRRSKSLPSTLLDDADEFTFLELLHLLPPVTRFTLRELDLEEILSNVQLRHDLIFDPDLQFRPNMESDRDAGSSLSSSPLHGASSSSSPESKPSTMALTKADVYWQEVEEEISQGFLYRIPLLLTEIQAILIELLPNGADIRDEIEANIDIKLISQQIEHGVVNPMSLILYLSQLMKTNCAPVRDEIVDQMVAACEAGNIAKSLRLCFDILEYMKLDYANHQLSRLRPYVLQHSAEFEWKWFQSQLDSKQTSTWKTKAWLKEQYEASIKSNEAGTVGNDTDLIVDGILSIIQTCSRSSSSTIPETLRLDSSRLSSHSNDWQDITILSSILVLFRQAAGPKCTHAQLMEMKKNLWLLLNDGDTTLSHIALQMARVAGDIRGRPFDSKEQEALSSMIDKTLAPDSKLYELLLKRVGSHLKTMSMQKPLDKDALAKHGLQYVETEIEDLGRKIAKLIELHKSVYGKLYRSILDEIKNGNEQ